MKYSPLVILSLCLFSCSSFDLEKQTREINTYYKQAILYRDANQIDSAFLYFIKAEDLAKDQRDSLIVGKSLVNLAILYTNKGDYWSGQELSFKARKFLNSKNKQHHGAISSNYNNLGIASQNLRDYQNAVNFYDTAIKYTKDTKEINLYLNNKGYVYQLNKQYSKALEVFSLIQKSSNKDNLEYIMALANTSFTKWQLDKKYNPLPQLLLISKIREKKKDETGLNSSYSYLSDYYAHSNPDSALFYAHKMYSTSIKLTTIDDQLYALQKLIKLSPSSQSKEYFERYLKLDDSAQNLRNKVKNQFAVIRYGVEENKAENLKLLEENTTKKYQLIILSLLGILFLISGMFLYRKRKQRIVLEAQNTINEHQLKTSKKVHDVVANGLYTIMTKLDNREAFKDDPIVDEMEELYEKSRNISYEKNVPSEHRFNEKLFDILKSFESKNTEVLISGNEEKMWIGLNSKITFELEHTLQELMVNMKKHSQASKVTIKFEKLNNQIHISYTDNGKGIKDFSPGNGLRNTETRIKSIAGLITFDTKPNEGLKVNISFPI